MSCWSMVAFMRATVAQGVGLVNWRWVDCDRAAWRGGAGITGNKMGGLAFDGAQLLEELLVV
jgi:hypothetical protein